MDLLSKFPLLGTHSSGEHARGKELPHPHPIEQATSTAADLAMSAAPLTSSMRLIAVDSAGCRRVRVVPASSVPLAKEHGVAVSKALMALPVHTDTPAAGAGITGVGQVSMVPVEDSAVVAPWAPVPTRLVPVQLCIAPGVPWECCPRTALERALRGLKDEYQLTLRVSFTTEFVLLRMPPNTGVTAAGPWPWVPIDAHNGQWSQSLAVDANAAVLEEMAQVLASMGITVLEYYAGAAPGQFVMATGQFEALEAADMLVMTREAIAGVARKHGILAIFAPKYVSPAGNACHCHLSLWKDGKNIMAEAEQPPHAPPGQRPTLSTEAVQLLSGILTTLPAAMPFLAPSFHSYSRFAKGIVAWSWDNPDAPVRVTCPPSSDTQGGPFPNLSVVVSVFDASTNPYIGLASLVASMSLGMLTNAPMTIPLITTPVSSMTAAEKAGYTPLPASLSDALAAYESENKDWLGQPFKNMMGGTLLGAALSQAYLAVRKAEADNGPGVRELCLRY